MRGPVFLALVVVLHAYLELREKLPTTVLPHILLFAHLTWRMGIGPLDWALFRGGSLAVGLN